MALRARPTSRSTPAARPRRRRGLRALLASVLAFTLVACDPPDDGAAAANASEGLRVEAAVTGEPGVGPAEVVVTVVDGDEAVTEAEVEVTGDMTHAGMVPVVAAAPHQGEGRYRTEGFEFTMAGDWILTVEATRPNGETRTETLALTVPAED